MEYSSKECKESAFTDRIKFSIVLGKQSFLKVILECLKINESNSLIQVKYLQYSCLLQLNYVKNCNFCNNCSISWTDCPVESWLLKIRDGDESANIHNELSLIVASYNLFSCLTQGEMNSLTKCVNANSVGLFSTRMQSSIELTEGFFQNTRWVVWIVRALMKNESTTRHMGCAIHALGTFCFIKISTVTATVTVSVTIQCKKMCDTLKYLGYVVSPWGSLKKVGSPCDPHCDQVCGGRSKVMLNHTGRKKKTESDPLFTIILSIYTLA
jgi:hypothetical protein